MDPHAEYDRRRAFWLARAADTERRLAIVGNIRFGMFLAAVAVFAVTVLARLASPVWLLVPITALIVLSVRFGRLLADAARAARGYAWADAGLARLTDRWSGRGTPGTEFLDESHPYAADLDLFGKGSLFEKLCDARTRSGRETLAGWLLRPAALDEVRDRQQAVRDLAGRTVFREALALAAGDVPAGIDTAGLAAWGQQLAPTGSRWPIAVANGLVGLTGLTGLGWVVGWTGPVPLLAAAAVQTAFGAWLRPRVRTAIAGVHGRSRDLSHLAGLLAAVEAESFAAPRLVRHQSALNAHGPPPSVQLDHLLRLVRWLDTTRNPYFAVLAPALLWTTRVGLAVEQWRRTTGPALAQWLDTLADVEALSSLAGAAFENPDDVFPELTAEGVLFDAIGLGHPLLPRSACVTNDVRLDKSVRLLLVSGSNMSGKSTFLRAVGTAAVLALAGAAVRATRLQLSALAVGATLRVQDSLLAGKSRFYAEITRLRAVVDLARGSLPVLFLLDEVLAGTNSHDRRLGAEGVLRGLLRRPTIGLVTTHDLALTELAEKLGPGVVNVHFEDEMVGGELRFDYRLRPGIVQHSNALALMRAVGLEVDAAPPAT